MSDSPVCGEEKSTNQRLPTMLSLELGSSSQNSCSGNLSMAGDCVRTPLGKLRRDDDPVSSGRKTMSTKCNSFSCNKGNDCTLREEEDSIRPQTSATRITTHDFSNTKTNQPLHTNFSSYISNHRTAFRVLIRFFLALLVVFFMSIFYTFGLKEFLFHRDTGFVTSLFQSDENSPSRSEKVPSVLSSLGTSNLWLDSSNTKSKSFHHLLPATQSVSALSPARRSLLATSEQSAEEVERTCENIESLPHPLRPDDKLNSQEKCEFVSSNCDENLLYVFYYCHLEAAIGYWLVARIIFYIIAVYCSLVLFYILADTADTYFSPALLKLSGYLRLPPNLAGVTLLALGSGAPELCSTVAGLVNDNSDLAISVPIGGGVFVTSVVVGAVALFSNVRVSRRPFIRDVGSYLIAVTFVFIIYLDGRVRLFEGIMCWIIYFLYVLIVVVARFIYQRRKKKRLNRKKMQKKLKNDFQVPFLEEHAEHELEEIEQKMREDDELPRGTWFMNPLFEAIQDRSHEMKDKDAVYIPGIGFIMNNSKHGLTAKKYSEIGDRDLLNDEKFEYDASKKTKEDEDEDKPKVAPVITDYFSPVDHLENDDDDEEGATRIQVKRLLTFGIDAIGWSDMNWHEKLVFLAGGWYCQLARNLTIPKSESEEWNKYFSTVSPFLGTMFLLLLIFQLFSFFQKWRWWMLALWIIPGILAILFGMVTFFTAEKKRPPIYNPILVTFAFVMCMAWIFFAADNLVKFLEVVGATLGIPSSVLGITILAWGNSIGDMIANVVIARAGFATMAISASYASPLLNALIGLGMSFVFNTIKGYINALNDSDTPNPGIWSGLCFETHPDPALTMSFIFLITILVSSLVCVPLMRFRIRKPFACWLFLLYVLYVILALVSTLVMPVNNFVTKYIHLHTGTKC